MDKDLQSPLENLSQGKQSASAEDVALFRIRYARGRFDAKLELALKELTHWSSIVTVLQSAIKDCDKHEDALRSGQLTKD